MHPHLSRCLVDSVCSSARKHVVQKALSASRVTNCIIISVQLMPVTQCACLDGQLPAMYDHLVEFPFFVFLVWTSQCEPLSSRAVWTAECWSAGVWSSESWGLSTFSFTTRCSKGQTSLTLKGYLSHARPCVCVHVCVCVCVCVW